MFSWGCFPKCVFFVLSGHEPFIKCALQIVSPHLWFLFILFQRPFKEQKFLSLRKSNLLIYSLMNHAFGAVSKKCSFPFQPPVLGLVALVRGRAREGGRQVRGTLALGPRKTRGSGQHGTGGADGP